MRTIRQHIANSALFVLLLSAPPAQAEVRLPKILSSHMVIQREQPVHLWGWSEPGEKITATLNGAGQSTSGDRLGHWNLYLPPMPAGGPFQITVTGRNKIVLDDVLIGDVWMASGQSNMEMPLNGFPGSAVVNNAAEEIKNANQPGIRLLLVPHKTSSFPLGDFDGEVAWTVCTPETAAKFSAVAYFFGRDVRATQHVPIGLIDATWGGTPAEAWMSLDGISADASLMPALAAHAAMVDEQASIPEMTAAEKRADAEALMAHQPAPKHPWHPDPRSWEPAWLYNGMIAPATGYTIRGAIWYQGESNSRLALAPLYERVFPALIADWRKHWRIGNFPFLYVQISSFRSTPNENWPAIREAQRRTLAVTNTAMAVTIDIGDAENVHPPDKQTVGARLALAARAVAYGEKVEYSGPLFRQSTPTDDGVRVWFDHAGGDLQAKDGPLQGFEIAGEDHRFFAAEARIDGSSVVVGNPAVERPRYVRYGWQNAPAANLYNRAGLPASPFTSED